ncbi:hypothetical protein AA0242T_0420 [Acetobacter aceti NRIC 0242]|uniref:Uncharacterized protein n=1 Tax=Acetobacter aceti NBRC 14818 TaxID=887700 RepID=A0AB33ILZ5_ACEAC|nr:hypothetical protein EMQ_2478 [Acetobacter aceti NBRC 14818]GAN56312.1 hypothetical protein Abac_006_040 [Acetobacter aceti NBRC 14818]GBO79718.1 hypothetical protein AA0242T_0420 [Acetobacter aceti NRIC 0242]
MYLAARKPATDWRPFARSDSRKAIRHWEIFCIRLPVLKWFSPASAVLDRTPTVRLVFPETSTPRPLAPAYRPDSAPGVALPPTETVVP